MLCTEDVESLANAKQIAAHVIGAAFVAIEVFQHAKNVL